MKPIALLLAGVFLPAVFTASSRADVYTVRRQGATIVPERSEDISMDAEDVLIERHLDGYNVTATFVMRNHSDGLIDSLVAFPITGSTYTREQDVNQKFRVEVRGGEESDSAFIPVKARVKAGRKRTPSDDYPALAPPRTIGDYPEVVVWNVRWEPRQTRVIRVQFDMGEPMSLPGSNYLADGWQLMYIVTTGSLWKGPIGRADISARFTNPAIKGWSALERFRQVSYPNNAKWSGNDLVTWHFENWTPTEEIWVRSARWTGLSLKEASGYRFFLPGKYRGAQMEYSAATIEDFVTEDLKFSTEYFPMEVQAFDRKLLRIAIADWLLHEIYARRGDSFYIGPESPVLELTNGRVGIDDHLYSWWVERFNRGYGYRDGWYNPDYSPGSTVKTSTLHPIEQQNVRFLRAYLDRIREKPAYLVLREQAHVPGAE